MATATKTARTLQSSTSNAAGGTTTGSSIDLTTAFGGLATGKITNGVTGPTVACSFKLEVSQTGTGDWKTFFAVTADIVSNGVYEWSVRISPEVMHIRSVFTGNTGQAVTVEAFLHELTSIA